jgi:hypothetical protein
MDNRRSLDTKLERPTKRCISATTHAADSLDQRYLDFTARTSDIFAQLPQLEPLRHFIFKELLVQRDTDNDIEIVKHWLRPLLRWGESRGSLTRADVLIWVESCREVIVEALLPVYRTLVARGIKSQLVWSRGPADLPSSALAFRYPARAIAPAWVKNAWETLCDEIEELRDKSLEQKFSYACANTQGLLDEVNRVLDVVQPKVVLAASTQLSGGAALMTSARSRALTLLLQHGILQPFYTPLIADNMLTWGQSSNRVLIDLGIPQERLVALGSPRHDSMSPPTNGDSTTKLSEALSLPRRPTFVFFSNGNDLVRNGIAPIECAQWLESTASRYANSINVVVRLHPNEDGSLYKQCPHLTVSKLLPDLMTTLEGSDWVGSLCSTVLYDALLYRKPVWQFYADGWPELADNWKCGLANRISSPAELDQMVGRALGNDAGETVPASVIDQVFANHARATEHVVDFVQDQMQKRDYGTRCISAIDQVKPSWISG